jgi:citrate lyase beta subunit
VAGGCGLQFTDNLGTAVAKGFDLQAEMLFGPVNIDGRMFDRPHLTAAQRVIARAKQA